MSLVYLPIVVVHTKTKKNVFPWKIIIFGKVYIPKYIDNVFILSQKRNILSTWNVEWLKVLQVVKLECGTKVQKDWECSPNKQTNTVPRFERLSS